MLAYVNGFFAGLSGCVLPVLSIMITRRNHAQFILEFFLAQFALFTALNLAFAWIYSIMEWIQPVLLLAAAGVTLWSAYSIYTGKQPPIPHSGALYGIALTPCSVGFAIATATTSFGWIQAIANAFLFALGIITPIAVVASIARGSEVLLNHGKWLERASVALLILVSYYLAYLAGASWRWIP